eukprot:GHVT01070564.1.p1 GENE.GHVT01070564.1~~GHVT01070564.1.p1  ORF type:complete len:122 (+),score=8.60 GHVT01070564.1:63-428(+)
MTVISDTEMHFMPSIDHDVHVGLCSIFEPRSVALHPEAIIRIYLPEDCPATRDVVGAQLQQQVRPGSLFEGAAATSAPESVSQCRLSLNSDAHGSIYPCNDKSVVASPKGVTAQASSKGTS